MAENEPDKDDLTARLAGAMGGGDPDTRRPVSLTEALYQRIVDVTRSEVSQTTEVLGEVIVQIGRLERRIEELTDHLDAGGQNRSSSGADSDLGDRLERLEAVLGRIEGGAGLPDISVAPVADLSAVEARLDALGEALNLTLARMEEVSGGGNQPSLRAISDLLDQRLAELGGAGASDGAAQVISRGLAEVRTALLTSQPDLTPVVRAVNQSVDDIRAELAGLRLPAAAPAGVDTEVIAQSLAELRAALSETREQLGEAGGIRPEQVQAAVNEGTTRIESALAELRDAEVDAPNRVIVEVEAIVSGLRSDLAAMRASFPQPEAPDLRPVLEAIHGLGAGLRDEPAIAHEPVDLTPVHEAISDLRSSLHSLAPDVDLGPIHHAINELRGSLPEPVPAVDLTPLTAAINELRGSLPEPVPAVDLTPLTAAINELRGSLPEPVPAVDLSPVTAAINELRGSLADQPETVDLSPVTAAMGELRSSLAARVEQLQQSIPESPDLDELRRGLAGDVSDAVRASVSGATRDMSARVDDLQAAVAALSARYAAKMDELRDGIADDSERLAERIDSVATRASRPTDLTEVTNAIRAGLDQVRAAIPPAPDPVDLTPLHDEMAANREAQERAADTARAALNEAVTQLRDHVGDQADRLRQALPPVPDPVDLQPMQAALDELRGEVRAIDGPALAGSIEALRQRVEQPAEPIEFSPVLDAVSARIREAVEELIAARPEPVDLGPITNAVAEGREDAATRAADQADHLAALIDGLRSQQDQHRQDLITRLGSVADDLRASIPQPTDLGPVLDVLETLSGDVRHTGERNEEEAAARAERLDAALAALAEKGDASADRVAALSERLGVIEQLGYDEATRSVAVTEAIDAIRSDQRIASDQWSQSLAEQLGGLRTAQEEEAKATGASLARIVERLDARPNDEALLDQVRSLLDELRAEMAEVRGSIDPDVLVNTFQHGTDAAVARLEASAEGVMSRLAEATEIVMARIDRRDSQLGSIKVDLELAVQRALQDAEADMDRIVGDIRDSVDSLSRGVEGVHAELRDNDHRDELAGLSRSVDTSISDLGMAVGADLGRVTASLGEMTRDLSATRERVLELDRNLTGLRNEVGGTAEVAQASYQTADTLQALIPAVASLENRIGAQLDDLGARLESLAALVDDRVPTDSGKGERQDRVALEIGTRLDAIREVAAGISEALRNDRKKRRDKALGSGS